MTTEDDQPEATRSIGALARLAGISVRTLHHYDAIGLLSPGSRTAGGYRAYTPADVARLQRILFYRELELPLDRIRALIDDPTVDESAHLRRQLTELDERIDRLRRIRDAVQTTMEAHHMNIRLTPEERLEVFGDHDPAQYEAEVQTRWGDTEAYRRSAARTASYSKDDWLRIKAEGDAIESAFASAMATGEPADGDAATALAEQYRAHMSASFYDLTHAMQREVSAMYVDDPRFRKHYEERAAGLAQYVRDAIVANAERHGA